MAPIQRTDASTQPNGPRANDANLHPIRTIVLAAEAAKASFWTTVTNRFVSNRDAGVSIANILLVAALVIGLLVLIFLLWGGNMQQLEEKPIQTLENTASQFYNDPRASLQRTERDFQRDVQRYGSAGGWAGHEWQS